MAQSLDGVARIVAVASGKGGVGKTTVAVNLALALSRLGHRVGLYDADLYGPNVPLMLGVRRDRAVRHDLPVARASREPYIEPLRRYGLAVMSIGLIVGETDTLLPDAALIGRLVVQTLRDVRWGALDYVVADLPPGSGEPQQSILNQVRVDGAVIVTTPQDLSLLDAGRSLGLFRRAGVPVIGLVENMSFLRCPHCEEPVEVFHRSEHEWAIAAPSVPLLGRVPLALDISRGIHDGHPLVQASPDAAAAQVFVDIARRVAAAVPPTR